MKFKYLMEDYSMSDDVLKQAQKDAEDLIQKNRKSVYNKIPFNPREDDYEKIQDECNKAVKDLEKACKKDDFEGIKNALITISIWDGKSFGQDWHNMLTPGQQELFKEFDHPMHFAVALGELGWNTHEDFTIKKEASNLFSKWCKNRGGGVKGFFKKLFGLGGR